MPGGPECLWEISADGGKDGPGSTGLPLSSTDFEMPPGFGDPGSRSLNTHTAKARGRRGAVIK